MGIYTSNRFFGEAYDYASEIPANEAYDAAFGCAHILADCQRNDMALFEHSIYSDIAEVKAIQEGTGYVNENAFTNVLKKIGEMFMKLLSKIKGIFKAFLAKLNGAFADNQKIVQKYEKQIVKYGNWKGFQIKKIRVPQDGKENIKESINAVFNTKNIVSKYKIDLKDKNIIDSGVPNFKTIESIKDAESDDIKLEIAKLYIQGVTFSEYSNTENDIMNTLFNEEKELNNEDNKIDGRYFSKPWIKAVLSQGKDWEKEIKNFNDKLDKNINTIIDNLKKANDSIADFMLKNDGATVGKIDTYNSRNYGNVDPNKGTVSKVDSKFVKSDDNDKRANKVDTKDIQNAIQALQKIANNEQEVITKVTSEYMKVAKFTIGQARKIWTAAAAWSSGVHKESVEYYQALGEAASEEFYMNMEAVC